MRAQNQSTAVCARGTDRSELRLAGSSARALPRDTAPKYRTRRSFAWPGCHGGNSRWTGLRAPWKSQDGPDAPITAAVSVSRGRASLPAGAAAAPAKMQMGAWWAIQSGLLVSYRNVATSSDIFSKKFPANAFGQRNRKGYREKQE